MTLEVPVDEAKGRFDEFLATIRSGGDEVVFTENGVAIARLSPVKGSAMPRVPGMDAGKVVIAPDFNAPLPDELLDAFEGR